MDGLEIAVERRTRDPDRPVVTLPNRDHRQRVREQKVVRPIAMLEHKCRLTKVLARVQLLARKQAARALSPQRVLLADDHPLSFGDVTLTHLLILGKDREHLGVRRERLLFQWIRPLRLPVGGHGRHRPILNPGEWPGLDRHTDESNDGLVAVDERHVELVGLSRSVRIRYDEMQVVALNGHRRKCGSLRLGGHVREGGQLPHSDAEMLRKGPVACVGSSLFFDDQYAEDTRAHLHDPGAGVTRRVRGVVARAANDREAHDAQPEQR